MDKEKIRKRNLLLYGIAIPIWIGEINSRELPINIPHDTAAGQEEHVSAHFVKQGSEKRF